MLVLLRLCVLTQELHGLTLMYATVLQSGHIVYSVLYHQLQICHCVLKSKIIIAALLDAPGCYNQAHH